MNKAYTFSLLQIQLRHDRHVVQARQRAREIAALLGFEHQDQIRLATACSELARNAYRYAKEGVVDFAVTESSPQTFVISVTDKGPGISMLDKVLAGTYVSTTGSGMGLLGTRRMMDYFHAASTPSGSLVECGKTLPANGAVVTQNVVREISGKLERGTAAEPFEEIERQNRELLKTLAALNEKQDQLAGLNRELEDTNRGVVALYAELEQHANDLRRVSDLKTTFLANLSHEFRTPLNSIAALSRLLLGHSDGHLSDEQEKQVSFIQRSAADLSELVDSLLDLAKVEAGKIEVKPRAFEVKELFSAMRGMLRPLLTGNSLELAFDAEDDIPTLFTDEGKVSQILRNLISNALKFTRKGTIRVTAQHSEGWVIFRVIDTGIGILPEHYARIFEEFVQIDGELQSQVKGTGLGLPLSRKLAELLGGHLDVESRFGEGSTFLLRIPAIFGQSELSIPPPVIPKETMNKTVLFIEDNRETSFVHQSALKHTEYRTVFAANLPEARLVMDQITPALIVLDRFMDQKDSLYYIEELRAQEYKGPILAISVVNEPKPAMEAGADAFLPKPIPPFTLLNMVRDLVEKVASKTILLVDDDEVTRFLIGGLLVKKGFRIIEAREGREAIGVIRTTPPDAVIMGMTMPDMTGVEILREIRQNHDKEAVPVILHSSRQLTGKEKDLVSDADAYFYIEQTSEIDDRFASLLKLVDEVVQTAGMAS